MATRQGIMASRCLGLYRTIVATMSIKLRNKLGIEDRFFFFLFTFKYIFNKGKKKMKKKKMTPRCKGLNCRAYSIGYPLSFLPVCTYERSVSTSTLSSNLVYNSMLSQKRSFSSFADNKKKIDKKSSNVNLYHNFFVEECKKKNLKDSFPKIDIDTLLKRQIDSFRFHSLLLRICIVFVLSCCFYFLDFSQLIDWNFVLNAAIKVCFNLTLKRLGCVGLFLVWPLYAVFDLVEGPNRFFILARRCIKMCLITGCTLLIRHIFGDWEFTCCLPYTIFRLDELLDWLTSFMEGSPLYVGGGASSSRPRLDLNEPPALEPEPEQRNRTSSPSRDKEAIPKELDLNQTASELDPGEPSVEEVKTEIIRVLHRLEPSKLQDKKRDRLLEQLDLTGCSQNLLAEIKKKLNQDDPEFRWTFRHPSRAIDKRRIEAIKILQKLIHDWKEE